MLLKPYTTWCLDKILEQQRRIRQPNWDRIICPDEVLAQDLEQFLKQKPQIHTEQELEHYDCAIALDVYTPEQLIQAHTLADHLLCTLARNQDIHIWQEWIDLETDYTVVEGLQIGEVTCLHTKL